VSGPPREGRLCSDPADLAIHVVLVAPEIHWNTGNAGRTCLAAGAQLHLIRPLGFRLDARSLRRAGLDYWERVAPIVWPSWSSFEVELPQLGEPFFFAAGSERSFWSVRYPRRTVLIFGQESVGLPPELRERFAHRLVTIPMTDPGLRSLNLSTTVGIALFEARRQQTAG
jgi:tRNA (cytidine/uridine-2'-O-)-methyltransferase